MKVRRAVFIAVLVLNWPTLNYAQDLSAAEARGQEIRSLIPLACQDSSMATPRAEQYAKDLKDAINELRIQLPKLNQQVMRSSYLGAVSPAVQKLIESQITALGDESKIPCAAARDFSNVAVSPASSSAQREAANDASKMVANPGLIHFNNTEAHSEAEASFSLTNKGTAPLFLEQAQFCDNEQHNCALRNENFSLAPTAETCPSPLNQSDHCTYKLTFAPKEARDFDVTIKFGVSDAENQRLKPMFIPVAATSTVHDVAHLVANEPNKGLPVVRSVVGVDISGTTSTGTQQKFFLEFDLNAPVGFAGKVCFNRITEEVTRGKTCGNGDEWVERRRDPLNRPLWFFFNPRITSISQQPTALSSLNIQGFTDLLSNKKTDLVQGVNITGGAELMLIRPRSGLRFFSMYRNTQARTGVALVAGGGFSTPFSALNQNPTVFQLAANSPLRASFLVPDSFDSIAFVNQERSRFFRKYYVGLRFKTYHFSPLVQNREDCDPGYGGPCESLYNAFPGIVDLTTGQDEEITGGHLSRWVLRIDAVYPLPLVPGMTIFGSMNTVFQKNHSSDPLFLPPTSDKPISDPTVFHAIVPPTDRDVYRLGIGFDLIQVIKAAQRPKASESKMPNPNMNEPPSANQNETAAKSIR